MATQLKLLNLEYDKVYQEYSSAKVAYALALEHDANGEKNGFELYSANCHLNTAKARLLSTPRYILDLSPEVKNE